MTETPKLLERTLTNDTDKKSLVDLFKKLREEGRFSQAEFIRDSDIGLSASRLSEILKDDNAHTRFKLVHLQAMYDFLDDQYFLDQKDRRHDVIGISDHTYFSLIDFLKVRPSTEKEIDQRMPGIYILYRPSFLIKKRITVALAVIKKDPTTQALKFTERCHIPIQHSIHDSIERKLSFDGFLVRRRKKYFSIQIDSGTDFPRTTIITEIYGQEEKAFQLAGVSLGIVGPNVYSSKMYLERIEHDPDKFDEMFEEFRLPRKKNPRNIKTKDDTSKDGSRLGFHSFDEIPLIAQSYITEEGFTVLPL